MTSIALDLASLAVAIEQSVRDDLVPDMLEGANREQNIFLDFRDEFSFRVQALHGLHALASHNWRTLDAFFKQRGSSLRVQRFDSERSIGVVSVVNVWVHGRREYDACELQMLDSTGKPAGTKPAFSVPESDSGIYNISLDGRSFASAPLVRMDVSSDTSVWMYPGARPSDGLDMFQTVLRLCHTPRFIHGSFRGATIPMVDMNVRPDMSWLVGMRTGSQSICIAEQEFRLSMDNTGARAKVANVITAVRSAFTQSERFVLNRPFYMWMTRSNLPIPLAAAYIDVDACKRPQGSLADL